MNDIPESQRTLLLGRAPLLKHIFALLMLQGPYSAVPTLSPNRVPEDG